MYPRAHRIFVPPRLRQPNYSADDGYSQPPGKGAPEEVQQAWHEAYRKAEAYYRSQRAPDPDVLASNTAWKTILLDWNKGITGKFTRKRNPERIRVGKTRGGKVSYLGSAPHKAADASKHPRLGKVIEIAWVDPSRGEPFLHVQRFHEPGLPDLVWDDDKKVLMFFPNVSPVGGPESGDLSGLGKQSKVYKRWAKGRAPRGKASRNVPDDELVAPVGVADTIVYRSDKFDKSISHHPDLRGAKEYVHQFDDDVFVEQSRSFKNNPPDVVNILGGRLDVLPGGIVH